MKMKEKVVRPGGLELPTFWFVAIRVKMLNALFGVAYGLETPLFPQLAAPNVAPKTELYRVRKLTRDLFHLPDGRRYGQNWPGVIGTCTATCIRPVKPTCQLVQTRCLRFSLPASWTNLHPSRCLF